jgi:hypothetical protein
MISIFQIFFSEISIKLRNGNRCTCHILIVILRIVLLLSGSLKGFQKFKKDMYIKKISLFFTQEESYNCLKLNICVIFRLCLYVIYVKHKIRKCPKM